MFEDELTQHIDRTAMIRRERDWLHLTHRLQFLIFRDDVRDLRVAMMDCIDDYLAMTRPYLALMARSGAKFRSVTDEKLAGLRPYFTDAPEDDAPGVHISSSSTIKACEAFGVMALSARLWQVQLGQQHSRQDGVSQVRFTFPLGFFAFTGQDINAFFDRCAERLRPFYGFCGVAAGGFPDSIEVAYQGPSVFTLAWGMPELEIDDITPAVFAHQGIRPASWLMTLGQDEIAKIGGLDAIRAALPEADGFRVHAYDHGVTLRAGNSPMPHRYLFGTWEEFLADEPDRSAYTEENAAEAFAQNFGADALAIAQQMQQGIIPDIPKAPPEDFPLRYRLAALTKPLRNPDPYQLHNDFYGSPYFDKARTLQYYERFDP